MTKWGQRLVVMVLGPVLAWGCCSQPGAFARLEESLKTVQAYYAPLLAELAEEPTQEKVKRAVVAADTSLLLAAELQGRWCPKVKAVEQAALAAAEAEKLAKDAGVKPQGGGAGH